MSGEAAAKSTEYEFGYLGVFSDGTEEYRRPSEPEPGDSVKIFLRAAKDSVARVMLLSGNPSVRVLMNKEETDSRFDRYSAEIVCGEETFGYRFLLEQVSGESESKKTKNGKIGKIFYSHKGCTDEDPGDSFFFTPGFHVPEWSKGAMQYQIFTDRFRNGCKENDVADKEYYYTVGHAKHIEDWNAFPDKTDIRRFYGGDLQGVKEKLDYLQSIGTEVIYLNPIFVSPSSHKYDVQDYEHVDPHFAVIEDDTDHEMQDWEKHNGFAPKYIKRVTSPVNLSKSDEFFADLCGEIHKRGMRIILDGVFNHCGSFNKWMDREGVYLGKQDFLPGAYQSEASPYRNYFNFDSSSATEEGFEGWWGYVTLPKLNYEGSPELCEKIYSIAEKWAKPPYSIDGWRLDVAADLGHSEDFNHKFWKTFRERLKAVNPELLIVAEHYGDPSSWLKGDQWDTVMNYDAFMDPLSYFLTGMEKHSDRKRSDLYMNGHAFFDSMADAMSRFQHGSLLCAMNELSNHDHSRFLTRTNMTVGRTETAGPEAASENINKGIFKEAVAVQMTWPGAPTVYYGDEAGQTGWTDPDSRRTYPWEHEDRQLIDLHKAFSNLRKDCSVLKTGSFAGLYAQYGQIAFARFDKNSCAVTACNNTDTVKSFTLPVSFAEVPEGSEMYFRILTTEDGFRTSGCGLDCRCTGCDMNISCTVRDGKITFSLPPYGACVLTN